jgi:hypothetical protein
MSGYLQGDLPVPSADDTSPAFTPPHAASRGLTTEIETRA